jgi:hypothetical protein
MYLRNWFAMALAAAALAVTTRVLPDQPSPGSAKYAELVRLIKPLPGESKWAAVPWEISLPRARERAVREDKPLFVWRAGGGDVLGRA